MGRVSQRMQWSYREAARDDVSQGHNPCQRAIFIDPLRRLPPVVLSLAAAAAVVHGTGASVFRREMDLLRRWKLLPRTNAGDTVFGGSDVADLRTLRTHPFGGRQSARSADSWCGGRIFSI